MGIVGGYLRFQFLVVVAVAMAVGALFVLTSAGDLMGLLALVALLMGSFAVLAVLLALRRP